ncbi:putative ribonuclease H-like domain-containing protein [Tanacetum coccineum]
MTHPHPNRRFVPQAVLTRSGKINNAGVNVNTVVRPVNTAGSKPTVNHPRSISNAYKKGYSQVTRPFNKFSANKNSIFNKEVNTVRVKDTTARDRAVVSENKGKGTNVVKASAYWVWKAKIVRQPIAKEYKEKGVMIVVEFLNGVAERKNRTLIEAARTMLVDSKLPTTFWAEAVNTACYVLNRVLVIKPHNKIPYELIRGRTPLIDFMKPFGGPVTILNTKDYLGKIVKETLNIRFLKNAPNVTGNRPDWLFDVDYLSKSMNYVPVVAGNQTDGITGTRDNIVAGKAEKKTKPEQEYLLIPSCTTDPLISQGPKDSEEDVGMTPSDVDESEASDKDGKDDQVTRNEFERLLQQEKLTEHPNSTNSFNTVSTPVSTAKPSFTNNDPSSSVNVVEASNAYEDHLFERFSPFKNAFTLPHVLNVTLMDDTGIFDSAYNDEDVGAEADLNNLETTINVISIPTTRINKDHPIELIIRYLHSASQTRRMSQQNLEEYGLVSYINKQRRTNHKDYQNCLFACFLFQKEPNKKVRTLVDLPNGKRVIETKWVFRNKKDERGIVVRNKARLVAQGYTQEEGINYDKVFAPVARIEEIRLFFAYALFMGFIVYQIDVKSALLYGTIEEEVYVCQPPSFEDPHFPDKVYKVEKALYGLHQAPKAWYETLSTYLIENGFRRGTIDKTLFIKKDKDEFYRGTHFLLRIKSTKRQKKEDDAEKEELRASMDVVPRDDIVIDVESLATKYLIVDWKTHVLTENMMYYQIIKADRSSKNYKLFSERLDDFERQDGDLKILFEPNEEDEIWKNQQDYNLISWRLFNSCGIHILLMSTGIAIHIMIEKKYPLTQEMLSRMLSRRLEVDHESEMAFELLRFIWSQLQK